MSTLAHEVVISGPKLLLQGFLSGYLLAKGLSGDEVLFAEDHAIESESMLEQIAEWMHLHKNIAHLIVPGNMHDELIDALKHTESKFGLVIKSDRLISSASFKFDYQAYNYKMFDRLHQFVMDRDDQISVSDDYSPDPKSDETAKGTESYTAVHDFEVMAGGTLTGPIEAILKKYAEGSDFTMMNQSKIKLHHPDDQ